ncbi:MULTISPECIES: EboA domain-containing protein [unclassified Marinovum]
MIADQLMQIVRANASDQDGDQAGWLNETLQQLASKDARERDLHIFLGLAPRKLGKADLKLSPDATAEIAKAVPGWRPDHWSIDGAARVLGLIHFNRQRPFAELFKDLRRTSDAAEMIALYRGLPLYPEPDTLFFEVGEGLRSNLRPVFEAIAHENPFPRDHFEEHRFNHMVLKALFIETALAPILGLQERANPELARILLDFAEERWAAHRPVSPEVWPLVKPFRDDPEIETRLRDATALGRLEQEALT